MFSKLSKMVAKFFERKLYIKKIESAEEYINAYFPDMAGKMVGCEIHRIQPHLQSQVGGERDGDCTITSISTVFEFLMNRKVPFESIYSTVLQCENPKWIYNGNLYGTLVWMIKPFMQSILDHYRKLNLVTDRSGVEQRMLKDVGYNSQMIMDEIKNDNPVILNIGGHPKKDYYHYHSITIVGYRMYYNKKGGVKILLKVYDNWSESNRFVDYDALPRLSTINFMK